MSRSHAKGLSARSIRMTLVLDPAEVLALAD
jgi:hypothetical protein